MEATKQKIRFEVSTLLDCNLPVGVAEEMVAAAERHQGMYEVSRSLPPRNSSETKHVLLMEYLFAVWPALPRLTEAKRVTFEVHPAPGTAPLPHGSVFYGVDPTAKKVSVSFHTPSWRAVMRFADPPPEKELFDKIMELSKQ
ncbi:MAG TPA: hypothetical protein VF384_05030 [Planctomycetota bacterium]